MVKSTYRVRVRSSQIQPNASIKLNVIVLVEHTQEKC